MKQADFEVLVEHIRRETTELLVTKGREYAGDEDRLANFKRGAALTNTAPLTVLFIYMSKHYDALATYIRDNQAGGAMPVLSEPITGRIADLINYCVLAWALIEESGGQAESSNTTLRRIKIRFSTGGNSLLDGEARDEFLVAASDQPFGGDLEFRGIRVIAWQYEGDEDWKVV